jgi:hypothetical protein
MPVVVGEVPLPFLYFFSIAYDTHGTFLCPRSAPPLSDRAAQSAAAVIDLPHHHLFNACFFVQTFTAW